jgi:hypothetical protein
MPNRIVYKALAHWLSVLPMTATCAQLAVRLRQYEGAGYLAGVVEMLPANAEWLIGLGKVTERLKDDNPRFDRGLFEEWVLGDV